jgi:hypothetical protein
MRCWTRDRAVDLLGRDDHSVLAVLAIASVADRHFCHAGTGSSAARYGTSSWPRLRTRGRRSAPSMDERVMAPAIGYIHLTNPRAVTLEG